MTRIYSVPKCATIGRLLTRWSVPRSTTPVPIPVPPMGQSYFPVQRKALEEIGRAGGGIVGLPVGAGKTLISLLAPVVLGKKRPLLVVPAALRTKTLGAIEEAYEKGWEFPRPKVVSYAQLGRMSGAKLLEEYEPDVLLADEAHRLANRDAAVTRRVERHLREAGVPFVALTGTLINRSLKEVGHLFELALGENSPLPTDDETLDMWDQAITPRRGSGPRMFPGALNLLRKDEAEKVAEALGRHIRETPGVVMVSSSWNGVKIEVERSALRYATPEEVEHGDFSGYMGGYLTDEERHQRAETLMLCGFYYRWDPEAPEEWLEARAARNRVVRALMEDRELELDSFGQAEKYLRDVGGSPELRYWDSVGPTFIPNPVAEFVQPIPNPFRVGSYRLELAPAIVWTQYREYGERAAEEYDMPFYGEGGRCKRTGMHIMDHPPGESCFASVRACSTGYNLQYTFHTNIMACLPRSPRIWEQLIGRTHREGQTKDVTIYLPSGTKQVMKDILRDAAWVEATTGLQQKLQMIDWKE